MYHVNWGESLAMEKKTTALTQGAILSAIYIILLIIVAYVPFINVVVLFFLPVPFIIHVYKQGLKAGVLIGLTALFLTPLFTPLVTIMLTFFAVTVGLAMGYFFVQKKGAFTPIIAAIITYIGNYLVIFLLAYLLFDLNLVNAVQQMMEESFTLTEQTAQFLNLPLDDQGLSQFKETLALIPVIFPALLIMSSIVMGFLHYLVSKPILNRVGCPVDDLPPFREWTLPKSLLFYYLGTLILLMVGLAEESTLFMLVANLHPILEMLLLIQGLSVISYFAHWKGMGKALTIIAVILTFLVPIFQFIVRLLGIFDLGFGLKQKMR